MGEELGLEHISWRELWSIAVRRRWAFMAPLFALGFIGFGVAVFWPNQYRSVATVLVEQQKVPEQYVTPNVITNLQDRLQSLTQQILSRTRLKWMIEQFALYPRERSRMTMEELVDRMRQDIQIEPIKALGRQGDVTAFSISYTAPSPRVAQQVAAELTSLFIQENVEARTQQSASTTSFLQNQLDQARKDLGEQERHLREVKTRYLGALPEQQQSNLQILSSLEAQLQATAGELDRAEQEKVYLESMRSQYKAIDQSLQTHDAGAEAAADPVLIDLRKQLAELEAKYTPQHPDVIRLKQEIAQEEARDRRSKAGRDSSLRAKAASANPALGGQTGLAEIESRLKATALKIDSQTREMNELRARIREFQGRLNVAPLREQQLSEVTRDYENSRDHYQSLLGKQSQSELATNLEKRQQGEQFRIIDPASAPQKPVEPNRAQIILIGWLVGLCGGIGLVAFRELTDNAIRSEAELVRYAQLQILLRLSPLVSPQEELDRTKLRILETASVTLLLLLCAGTGFYAYWVA